MDAKLILILLLAVVAAAFAAALVVVLSRSRGRGGQMLERSTAATATAAARPSPGDAVVTHKQINVKFGGELLEMLSSGRREEVVRLVRERAGIGEAEAEAVVAKLETVMGRSKK